MSTLTGQNYGSLVNITITAGTLANNAQWGALAVNSSAQNQTDANVFVKFTTNSTTVAAPNVLNVYIATSVDGTTGGSGTFDDFVTGLDATQTLTVPPNCLKLFSVNCPVANKAYQRGGSIRRIVGFMPAYWAIIVENKTGGALTTGLAAWYAYANLKNQ